MNYPVGRVVEKGNLPSDFSVLFSKLESQKFNGYIVQSVLGSSFLEEGVLFIREGFFVGSIVECNIAKKTLKGINSLEYFTNQTKGLGFYQIVELSRSQVDLITAFDELLLFPKQLSSKEIALLIPSKYVERFSGSYSQTSVFEEFGLGDLK